MERGKSKSRTGALRRAGRMFWRMVIWRSPKAAFSRRVGARLALQGAVCGLMTGGEHAWGPLRYEYEGAPYRKSSCRWCDAKITPGSEFAAKAPPSPSLPEPGETMTDADVARAIERAKQAGLLRNGKWVWD